MEQDPKASKGYMLDREENNLLLLLGQSAVVDPIFLSLVCGRVPILGGGRETPPRSELSLESLLRHSVLDSRAP